MNTLGRRRRLFLIISLAVTASFFLLNLMTGASFLHVVIYDREVAYSDYFYQTLVSSDGSAAYFVGKDTAFPAFSYLLYHVLYRLSGSYGGDIADYQGFMASPRAMTVFVCYNVLQVLLLCLCVFAALCIGKDAVVTGNRGEGRLSVAGIMLAIALSYPFLATCVQRGNNVAFAAICLVFACLWMDDASPRKKELSLILIAVAAGLKIVPAIYGLFFIKRKEWQRGMRLVAYGLIVFFVPFLFFGGAAGLTELINKYLHMESDRTELISAKGILQYLLRVTVNRGGENAQTVFSVIAMVFCALLLACFFLAKTRWQETLFLSGIMIAALRSNHNYVTIYLLVPLLMYLRVEDVPSQKENVPRRSDIFDVIYTVIFALIFSLPWFFMVLPEGDTGIGGVHAGVALLVYVLLLWNAADVLRNQIKRNE